MLVTAMIQCQEQCKLLMVLIQKSNEDSFCSNYQHFNVMEVHFESPVRLDKTITSNYICTFHPAKVRNKV